MAVVKRAADALRLFTPGPLSTSRSVRAAMDLDLGSRTPTFAALTRELRAELEAIAECGADFTVVPVQGSGMFAIEAMLSTLVGTDDHVLVVENGVYSRRMADICRIHRIRHTILALAHDEAANLAEVERCLVERGPFSHLAAVHFETGLGVRNDLDGLIAVARRQRCKLMLDAISSFGALPIDFTSGVIAAAAVSANKCLHGVPGVSFVIAARAELASPGPARTLSLDLRAQWRDLEHTGEWRFTPPIQVLLALRQAIREYRADGGRAMRYRRYEQLADRLVDGLTRLGIHAVIDARWRAPMIATFAFPPGCAVEMTELHAHLARRGLIIYPSKLGSSSFRIGCMGEICAGDVDDLLAALGEIVAHGTATEAAPAPGTRPS